MQELFDMPKRTVKSLTEMAAFYGIENTQWWESSKIREVIRSQKSETKAGAEDGTEAEIVNAEQFFLLEMKLKVVSNYQQLWDFLNKCEDSGFYVTVDNMAIGRSEGGGTRLEGDVQVNFYSIVNDEMAEEARK